MTKDLVVVPTYIGCLSAFKITESFRYLPLTQEDLTLWDADPEEFGRVFIINLYEVLR